MTESGRPPSPGCPRASAPGPPRARRDPRRTVVHGTELLDDYAWLRERDAAEVIEHLEAENRHTEAVLGGTRELQDALYDEMLARIEEDDSTVPVRIDSYWYHSRTETGRPYAIHERRRDAEGAPDELLVDVNALAEGHEYFRLGAMRVSPGHDTLALCTDAAGTERFVLALREIASGTASPPVAEGVSTSVAWSADGAWLFYVELDAANRPWRVRRHRIGDEPGRDAIVYEEPDERFFVSVRRTRSRAFMVIDVHSAVTSEVHLVPADRPDEPPRRFAARREGVEYDVGHHGERFYVRTNDAAQNFHLFAVPAGDWSRGRWREVVPHRPEIKLEGVDLFRDHMVRVERADGLRRLVVHRFDDGEEHVVELPESVAAIAIGSNPMHDQGTYRFSYSSMVTPATVYDYHVGERRLELRKRQKVLGGYDRGLWETRRVHATAEDGTRIPISLVHARGRGPGEPGPCLLYGYGAYGICLEPAFSSLTLSLLERGFVYAIAHVRGGGELGEPWHDAGRMEHKERSFGDFIACADHLVASGWADRDRLAIRGGSAGGLLVGAVLNRRPDLCAAAIANVPFVDVVQTMLDESLPLTVTEYEEWGNPSADPEAFRRMLGYSPYDNVRPACYPHLLVTAGLNDPRVQYWEPAKWVARLRATRTCRHRLLLKTNMGAGHAGPSGRYDFLRERAFEYAFLLDTLGVSRS